MFIEELAIMDAILDANNDDDTVNVDNDIDPISDILPGIKVSDGEDRSIAAIISCCHSASQMAQGIAANKQYK